MFYIIKKIFININKNQALFLDTDFSTVTECIPIIFSGVYPESFYCIAWPFSLGKLSKSMFVKSGSTASTLAQNILPTGK